MSKWLHILASIGPQILLLTPLAPIAPAVILAIHEAEGIKGATGAEKKKRVTNIIDLAITNLNAQAGKPLVDATQMRTAVSSTIDAVVNIVNTANNIPVKPTL